MRTRRSSLTHLKNAAAVTAATAAAKQQQQSSSSSSRGANLGAGLRRGTLKGTAGLSRSVLAQPWSNSDRKEGAPHSACDKCPCKLVWGVDARQIRKVWQIRRSVGVGTADRGLVGWWPWGDPAWRLPTALYCALWPSPSAQTGDIFRNERLVVENLWFNGWGCCISRDLRSINNQFLQGRGCTEGTAAAAAESARAGRCIDTRSVTCYYLQLQHGD